MKKLISALFIFIFILAGCSSDEAVDDNVLKVVMKDLSPTDENLEQYRNNLNQGLADAGIDAVLEFVETPPGTYSEKVNLLIQSGDIPDIMYFQGGDLEMSNQNVLEDLTSYIDSSELIQNAMTPTNEKRMENYPYLLWIRPINSKVPVIRTDKLNEMSTKDELLSNPTVENYVKFFEEVKEETGNAAITIPGNLIEIDAIFASAFGTDKSWIQEDGKYINSVVSENEKNKLEFYADLYEKGLLDNEYLTKAWDTKEEAFYNGSVGVISGTAGSTIDVYQGNMISNHGDNATLTVLPPAKGIGHSYDGTDVSKESRGLSIFSESEKKDLAWEVIEFFASDAGQKIDRLGVEDVHFNTADDGKITLTDQAANWYPYFFEVPSWTDADLVDPIFTPAGQSSLDMANEYYVESVDFIIPPELAIQFDATTNKYNEFAANVVTGKASIDEFDAFVKEWYDEGGQELTDYANENLQ